MQEIWKDIPGYEGIYKINNVGDIVSINFGKTKKEKQLRYIYRDGYKSLNLKGKLSLIHRMVAITFIPNPEGNPCVNHKNGIKTDNRVENLEWCTKSENTIHAYKTGLLKQTENNTFKKNPPAYWDIIPSCKKVMQYSKSGEFIKEWDSMTKASVGSGAKIQNISLCCKGKGFTAGGYVWKYSNN